jgi:hypothetical protein
MSLGFDGVRSTGEESRRSGGCVFGMCVLASRRWMLRVGAWVGGLRAVVAGPWISGGRFVDAGMSKLCVPSRKAFS